MFPLRLWCVVLRECARTTTKPGILTPGCALHAAKGMKSKTTHSAEAVAPAKTGARELTPEIGNNAVAPKSLDPTDPASELDILMSAMPPEEEGYGLDAELEPDDSSLTVDPESGDKPEPGNDEPLEEADSSSGLPEADPDEDSTEEADPDAEPEAPSKEDESEEDSIEDRLTGRKRDAQSRINQVTARAKKAEKLAEERAKENEQLKAQLAAAQGQSGAVAFNGDDEWKALTEDIKTNERGIANGTALLRELDEGNDEKVTTTLKQIFPEQNWAEMEPAKIRTFIDEQRELHRRALTRTQTKIALRERELEQAARNTQAEFDGFALKTLPFLNDAKDSRYRKANEIIKQWPELDSHPLGLLAAGLMAQHLQAIRRTQKAKEAVATAGSNRVRPRAQSGGNPASTRRSATEPGGESSRLESAVKHLSENPDDESAELAVLGALVPGVKG